MDAKRRVEIEERLAAVASSRWTLEMLSSLQIHERRFVVSAPADIRDLLDENAALAQELARVREQSLALAKAQAADLIAVAAELEDDIETPRLPPNASLPVVILDRALLASTPALLELAAAMAVSVRCNACPAYDDCEARDGGGYRRGGRMSDATDCASLDFTAEKIAEMMGWPYFAGFTASTCGKCGATANVPHGPGWFCPCGYYNCLSWYYTQTPHDVPDYGPTAETLRRAWALHEERGQGR